MQGRFLAVDQGNSYIKLTLLSDGAMPEVCRVPSDAVEDMFSIVERWNPDCGAFCSVGRIDPRMVESLRIALDGRLLILSRSTRLPVSIDYATPASLGLDRVALAVGAASLYKGMSVAVVDAGTAVTLDVVDETPSFRGGRITAGVSLRFDALNRHTAALPLVGVEGPVPMAGYSTDTALRSGVVLGLADEITETFNQYNKSFGCSRLVLTGGDAATLYGHISSRIPADHVPDLMARGLLHIYNHNEIYS